MNRKLSDIIGTVPYYTPTAAATLKIKSQDGSEDIEGRAYTYQIKSAKDKTQVGKYGLTTTYRKADKDYTDTFIGTQGEVLAALKSLEDGTNSSVSLNTKSYSDANPLRKTDGKTEDVTAGNKEWKAAAGNTETKGTTPINKWDALGEETNQQAKPELSATNLTESSDKKKVLGNVDDNIELTFNETVANPDGIELWDANAKTKIAATVTLRNDSQTPTVENSKVIIDPSSPLTAGGKYEVRNSGGTKLADLAVNPNVVSDSVVNFSIGGTPTAPGAPGSAPAVSEPALGEVNAAADDVKVDIKFDKPIVAANADESISVKVNREDKSLAKEAYTIAGNTLSINKTGIHALGITNATADNRLIVNADQIADKADPTKKNVVTGELVLQAKAPAAADSNPNPRIITSANQEFAFDAPIELTFNDSFTFVDDQNPTITVTEVDEGGSRVADGDVPNDLSYALNGSKLRISTSRGFTAQKRYQVMIQAGVLQKSGGGPYEAKISYFFKTKTPSNLQLKKP